MCWYPEHQFFLKWTKLLTLDIAVFGLKMMVKSGLEKKYFEIPRALSGLTTFSINNPWLLTTPKA
jgi:hypothetical protein